MIEGIEEAAPVRTVKDRPTAARLSPLETEVIDLFVQYSSLLGQSRSDPSDVTAGSVSGSVRVHIGQARASTIPRRSPRLAYPCEEKTEMRYGSD
jgi:hypothetical protein